MSWEKVFRTSELLGIVAIVYVTHKQHKDNVKLESIMHDNEVKLESLINNNNVKFESLIKEERLNKAKTDIKNAIKETSVRFVDDENENYRPFLENSALENAIKSEIIKTPREPGAVIILAPKEAGKSTRMSKVVRTLTEEGKIEGGYRIPKEILARNNKDSQHLEHLRVSPFTDLLPESKKPIILILDLIDQLFEKDADKQLKRIKEFTTDLAMRSVTPEKLCFQVYVLTNLPQVASELLTINGGKKVRLIGYGK